MKTFIDKYRVEYGVEPICKVLPIAPSTYFAHAGRQKDPAIAPPSMRRDRNLCQQIQRIYEENFSVYGARKIWRQLQREGLKVARCTVERLMRAMGLKGAIRGKPIKTTISDKKSPCP